MVLLFVNPISCKYSLSSFESIFKPFTPSLITVEVNNLYKAIVKESIL